MRRPHRPPSGAIHPLSGNGIGCEGAVGGPGSTVRIARQVRWGCGCERCNMCDGELVRGRRTDSIITSGSKSVSAIAARHPGRVAEYLPLFGVRAKYLLGCGRGEFLICFSHAVYRAGGRHDRRMARSAERARASVAMALVREPCPRIDLPHLAQRRALEPIPDPFSRRRFHNLRPARKLSATINLPAVWFSRVTSATSRTSARSIPTRCSIFGATVFRIRCPLRARIGE